MRKRQTSGSTGFTPLQPDAPCLQAGPVRNGVSNGAGEEGGIQKIKEKPRPLGRVVTGFTLIELLVVMAIIGVLAATVSVSLLSARRKSRDLRRVADIKQLQLALELYFTSNSSQYPSDINLLLGNNCGGSYCIRAIPQDPSSQSNYPYAVCGTTYHLAAGLEQDESGSPVLNTDTDAAPNTICPGDAIDGRLEDNNSSDVCAGGGSRNCYDVTSNQ